MTVKDDVGRAIPKSILDWLSPVGGIAAILFDLLSLFLDPKPAKQFAFGIAIAILVGALWHQHQRRSELRLPVSPEMGTTMAANRLIRNYLAVYKQDAGVRIPIRRLHWIQRFASQDVLKKDAVQVLLRLSALASYWTLAINITVSLVLTATLYAFLTTNYAFNPIDYAFGRGMIEKENPFIWLDSGSGTMIFGTDTPNLGSGEQPTQTIPVADFYIQQTEVTNEQYRICRGAGGCKSDPEIIKFYADEGYDNHPVIYISAKQAAEFCHWIGGELPSSEQWERAARGLYGQAWPASARESLPTGYAYLWAPGIEGTTEVTNTLSDRTDDEVWGLIGNVSEWTNSQLIRSGSSYRFVPWDGKNTQAKVIVRGGSWTFVPTRITQVQYRGPDKGNESIGFRCVISSD